MKEGWYDIMVNDITEELNKKKVEEIFGKPPYQEELVGLRHIADAFVLEAERIIDRQTDREDTLKIMELILDMEHFRVRGGVLDLAYRVDKMKMKWEKEDDRE